MATWITKATDDFQRGNETPLAGNWTNFHVSNFNLSSNVAIPSGGASDSLAYWNAATFVNDQFAQGAVSVTAGSSSSGSGMGVLLRTDGLTSPNYSHYRVIINRAATNQLEIARFNAAAYTSLKQVTQTFTNGDVLRAEISGYVISAYLNGSLITTFDDSASGSKIASGKVGIAFSSSENAASIDNWSGGDAAFDPPNSVGPLTGTASTIMPGGPGWRGK